MRLFKRFLCTLPDEQLAVLVAHGFNTALEVLYQRYADRVLHYFYRMLRRDEQKAQDMLHDLFVKLMEKSDRYTAAYPFRTWLFSIAHNMCKNEYRRRESRGGHTAVPADTIASPSPPAEERMHADDFNRALHGAINEMDREKRSIFLLRHQEGLSIKEIVESTGLPDGTVKSRLHYIHKELSEKLAAFNPKGDN